MKDLTEWLYPKNLEKAWYCHQFELACSTRIDFVAQCVLQSASSDNF